MDPLALGLTLALTGIGGTLVVLAGFGLLAEALKRIFPLEPEAPKASQVKPNALA